MKKLYTLFAALFFAAAAFAQQEVVYLNIEKTDNSTESINAATLQRITFDGSKVTFQSTDGVVENDMQDIVRITPQTNTGISQTTTATGDLVRMVSPDAIAVNCPAGCTITIYSISGSVIMQTRQNADYGTINIAALSKGIYLVRADGRTAKFIKR